MRVRIQSRPGKRSPSSDVQISPVGRRPRNTVLNDCPAPIFARTMCSPRGVRKLPSSSPAPCLDVDTEYRLSSLPSSETSLRDCPGIEISILGIDPAPGSEEIRELPARLGCEHAARPRRDG